MNLLLTAFSILFLFATSFFCSTELHLENIWKHVLDLPKNPAYVTNTQVNSLNGQFHGCAQVDFTAEGNFVR